MSIDKKIHDDLLVAMKAGDKDRVGVLRMLKAALANKKIAQGTDKEKELPNEEAMAVLKSEAKKRQDSIEAYKEGGRDDLMAVEEKELAIIKSYLPKQMSEDQLKEIIIQTISEVGASSQADFGKVMGAVMGKTKGQAEGEIVSKIVKELLS